MAKFLESLKGLGIGRKAGSAAAPNGLTRRAALGAAALGVTPFQEGCKANSSVGPGEFQQAGKGAVRRTMLDKMRDTVSVKDFGALGNGSADDTAAIQAAFQSGAAKVIFPRGRYLSGPLSVPDWLQIEGEGYQPGIGGDGRAVELRFNLRSGAGLTCGLNPVIRNIFLQNTGATYNESTRALSGTKARAIALTESAVIEDCCFSMWWECISTGASTYYLKTARLHFNRCYYGYRASGGPPYNMHIEAPASVLTDIFLSGAGPHYPRNVKVYGGSIEGYQSVAQHFSEISFFGTYFETDVPHNNVIAIDPGHNGSSVALFGCLIFMNRTSRFVSMLGMTNAMLTSVGNVFDGVGPEGGVCLALPASGNANLAGDRFGDRHPASCVYVDSIASASKFNIFMPELPTGNAQAAYGKMHLVAPRGFVMEPLKAAPSPAVLGMTVLADGKAWNPLPQAAGRPYWVIWQGNRWGSLSE